MDISESHSSTELSEENSNSRDPGLPRALEKLRSQQYLLAVAFLLAAVSGAFVLKDPAVLLISTASLRFYHLAASLEQRYRDGRISGRVLICESSRRSVLHDTVTVMFRTCDEPQEHFRFQIAGRGKASDMIPGAAYTVFFDTQNPSILLTYESE